MAKDMSDNQILDFKNYYLPGGDKGFNPKKNQDVIDRTIAKTIKMRKEKEAAYVEAVAERAHAAADYLFSRHGAQGRADIEKYFGKHELAKLRAEDISSKLFGNVTLFNN